MRAKSEREPKMRIRKIEGGKKKDTNMFIVIDI